MEIDMQEQVSVQVDHVHKNFGDVQALKNVSLNVAQGQIFGLLGPNGAGKTTLIRLLIGATTPSSGQLSVVGFDPVRQKSALRRLIGYMPQSPALYDDLSTRDNIVFFSRAYDIGNSLIRVEEVIDFVGLSERAHYPVYTLSGGMKQRVSLACALVHEPQMLFLDEPTSGIDPRLRVTFWEHFRELASKGVTLLISTHQMDEAMYCDRLGILHEGVLLADDSPRQLLWNNKAKINIWRDESVDQHEIINYPDHLPGILRDHGLDPEITRIEIKEDTLETVVLGMISKAEGKPHKEPEDEQGD